ncbi:MAG: hypothetical protein OHK0024_15280 [Thalassobaculales bacterium]
MNAVREQYEAYPYPPRDPEEERGRLIATEEDALARVNHYCFGGREGFQGFRALVAGGGTGDAAIYLAEQLRGRGEVTYIDLSAASRAIAEARAAVRGLANITFVTGSLIDLPSLGLGPFDYVNCCGVLHHLPDPPAGLAALAAVMRPGGALSLMVYADWGRAPVYPMQELMRLAGAGRPLAERVALARRLLAALPEGNLFRDAQARYADLARMGDAGLVDLLLHPVDRAYAIDALEALLAEHGFSFACFTGPAVRDHYRPEHFLSDPALLARAAALPPARRRRLGELLSGAVVKHALLAVKGGPAVADPADPAMVPFWFPAANAGLAAGLAAALADGRPAQLALGPAGAARLEIMPRPATRAILAAIDGRRPLAEIAPDPGAQADWLDLYARLNAHDLLLLRHRAADPIPDLAE